MVGRGAFRLALVVFALVGLTLVVVAYETATAGISLGQDRHGSAPVTAPISIESGQFGAATKTQTTSEQPAATGLGAQPPERSVSSGGPADAGPDVTYVNQAGRPQGCGPKPCPH